ncbi:MAG TPA: DUF4126 domain-containing protein [Thermodesulfovibrionales bacterium]|nr:DUF4126 domain-containing protein [Thermodesulfovibrionales bacterium]
MENLLSICLGLGLSAACGFRVFVPLLAISIASLSGHMTLSQGLEWIGTYPAFLAFAAAVVFEIAAYYIPWIDNLMDLIAGPAAVVAGTLVAASGIVHMDPLLKWSFAIIAGGGTAALFHSSTAALRAASTVMTGGIGNHAVATAELGTASLLSVLAITLPLLGIAVSIGLLFFLTRKGFRKLIKSRKAENASPR